jgi:predicted NAD-dependent protein-ADP-ribosyltransferase YbiA (DUF1768 family)
MTSLTIEPSPTSSTSDTPMLTFKARVNNKQSHMSNFYPMVRNYSFPGTPKPATSDHLFVHDTDGAFASVEHYYQWCKILIIDPDYARDVIRPASSPRLAKTLASKKAWVDHRYEVVNVSGSKKVTKKALAQLFTDRINSWRVLGHHLMAMRVGLRLKYIQNPELRQALVRTQGAPLGELGRSPWDYWAKTGCNMLGRLLVELRDELLA